MDPPSKTRLKAVGMYVEQIPKKETVGKERRCEKTSEYDRDRYDPLVKRGIPRVTEENRQEK